jgi:uncharacterized protein (DUF2267 family)
MIATQSVDAAARATEDWIDDFVQRLGWRNRTRAYSALIASLHALHDCLHQSAAIYLGAQLPVLPRGLYYEGWHPAPRVTAKSRGAFLERIHDSLYRDPGVDAEQVARGCLRCWWHAWQLRRLKTRKPPRSTKYTIFGRADS